MLFEVKVFAILGFDVKIGEFFRMFRSYFMSDVDDVGYVVFGEEF